MRLIHARMILVVLLIFFGARDVIPAGEMTRQNVYRNVHLGIEFRFPANWTYKKCNKDWGAEDCVGFQASRGNRRRPSADYIMAVTVKKMGLEKTIEQDGLFEKINGEWMKHGRFETAKSQKISGANWQGIYAIADCGISDANGFHAAAGECLTAILSNGNRSVTIETDGIVSPVTVLNQVVKSLKFIE